MQFTELQVRTGLVVGRKAATDGAVIDARGDRQGSMVATLMHGKYTQAVLDGNVFSACNQAAVSTSVGLTATYTGFAFANPPTSGQNAVLLQAYYGLHAAGTAGAIGLMSGSLLGTIAAWATLLVPRNRLMGGRGSVMLIDEGCTLPTTPVLDMTFASVGSVATTSWAFYPYAVAEIDGSMIVTPGYYVAFYASGGLTSSMIAGLLWEEIPI